MMINLYEEAKLQNFLPAFNNLHYIRLVSLANCLRYSNRVENLEHVFRDYSTVKEIWQMLNIIWPQAVSELEYKEWLLESPYVKIYFDVAFQNHSKRSCMAVQMDLVLGFLEVEIEGDALTIVKKLHATREDRYELGNRVAHLLAIEGIKRGVPTYLTQGMPFSSAIAVEKDWW
ncbi:hypothetical protein Gotur_010388 [Gossypium turneri]